MAGAITRKQFLRGDFTNRHAPIRPPFSLAEYLFVEICTQCGDCIKACPQNILFSGSGKYPEVDFSKGECTFCLDCVDSCNDNVLAVRAGEQPWTIQSTITDKCLVFKGIHCMTCREQCETEAIGFTPRVGQPPYPVIDSLLCNGCGACFQPCPNHAIKLSYQNPNEPDHGSYLKESAL
ncbi:MAG: ferredoxin-type protein NapF [Gammaproteobacteria bacterium]|nr:ferredoxin-type protein NapF [Gammaproteobacteria bacterium]